MVPISIQGRIGGEFRRPHIHMEGDAGAGARCIDRVLHQQYGINNIEHAMSRAFVKEQDGADAFEELADRPVSPFPNLVTAAGLAQIEAELARAQQAHAAAVAANERGAQARAKRELRYWTTRRASA